MEVMQRPSQRLSDSFHWEETDCLKYYEMLSLHEVFQIVGSQMTMWDVRVLSFLLDETFCGPHPLDPAAWTVNPGHEDPSDPGGAPSDPGGAPSDPGGAPDGAPSNPGMDPGGAPSPALLRAWRRSKPQGDQSAKASQSPQSGLGLLLVLERRGYLSEGNLEPLLRLLRFLTRHDLLPLVSRRKRKTVSPDRTKNHSAAEHQAMGGRDASQPPVLSVSTSSGPQRPADPVLRRRKRGHCWTGRTKSSGGRSGAFRTSLSGAFRTSLSLSLQDVSLSGAFRTSLSLSLQDVSLSGAFRTSLSLSLQDVSLSGAFRTSLSLSLQDVSLSGAFRTSLSLSLQDVSLSEPSGRLSL
ncbi:hypothetical protein NHX12_034385 [Muraenolepis orangiensis]|uniref:DED domain-containing protein n=1 Tax=Muraenolepis orangiensis TaxID=630683 RepID=A0A9Q0DA08_9TELE|nr:hypothetical protein NHX12_034385 [Muraenolepis orangiensis]